MLDQSTKRKIDSARNILVGKVPDPKAQVEQITTALIYKFMDDMDKESEELGGKSEFFSNGYEKFSWTKLMDKRLSGQERLDLYVQAISNMSKNPHIPQLFRNIFKDAFLPYRDFETLSLFLKEIDEFTYEHSENLGDAFEYLLAVLGSQGNAGQFRTPRHIIDFIVEVVDPKKKENILDPACGTAGFLISAYKHIIKHNSSNFKPEKEKPEEIIQEGESAAETVLEEKSNYTGDKLSPDEKANVMKNIAGYDISPDMVKLSLVNLYLHGFSNPVIHEYDTLTSEKRWNESFDVIMANPPFMTPKGGIRPHKRFQVQANRSEVLFVDYILEHLNLNGRSGIIVPEGIIFQSSNAYKRLRKLLIEDGLFAVVSLPPGVFNPYSGVKTCILFFDNQLAKKTDEILFVKTQNDGFDLGAQRRKIDKNDLPEALSVLEAWKKGEKLESELALWASKEKISESGDYNLTGDRYKKSLIQTIQKWPQVSIGSVCKLFNGRAFKPADWQTKKSGGLPIVRIQNLNNPEAEFNYYSGQVKPEILIESGDLLFSWSGSRGTSFGPHVWMRGKAILNQHIFKVVFDEKAYIKDFLYLMLKKAVKEVEENLHGGVGLVHITKGNLEKIQIACPPFEVQKEIVEQIEVKQKAIEYAKAVIKNLERERRYFGQSLRKLDDIEWKEIGEVCTFEYGKPLKEADRKGGDYPVFGSNGIVGYHEEYLVDGPFIIVGRKGTAGAVVYSEKSGFPIDTTFYIQFKEDKKIDLKYLYLIMQTLNLGSINTQAGVPGLNRNDAYRVKIPVPVSKIQKQLVLEAEKEDEIIEANQQLIKLMENKIEKVLSEI